MFRRENIFSLVLLLEKVSSHKPLAKEERNTDRSQNESLK